MHYNIKRILVALICAVFIFGFSVVSKVTAEDNSFAPSDSGTFIKKVNDGGKGGKGDKGEQTNDVCSDEFVDIDDLDIQVDHDNNKANDGDKGGQTNDEWSAEFVDIDDLDIQVNHDNHEIIYGPTWEHFATQEELEEEFENKMGIELNDLESEEITFYLVKIDPDDPTSSCFFCFTRCNAGDCRLRCLPDGCK